MMEKMFHCFWITPVGGTSYYREFDEVEAVLELVKKSNDKEDHFVCNLRVVYGELLEFEPATYVQTYRIKEKP